MFYAMSRSVKIGTFFFFYKIRFLLKKYGESKKEKFGKDKTAT